MACGLSMALSTEPATTWLSDALIAANNCESVMLSVPVTPLMAAAALRYAVMATVLSVDLSTVATAAALSAVALMAASAALSLAALSAAVASARALSVTTLVAAASVMALSLAVFKSAAAAKTSLIC